MDQNLKRKKKTESIHLSLEDKEQPQVDLVSCRSLMASVGFVIAFFEHASVYDLPEKREM
jgi:hypothetical protein